MLRYGLIFCTLVMLSLVSKAQQINIDSLRLEANSTQNDTIKLILLNNVARIYAELNPDSAYHYAEKSLVIARHLHLKLDEGIALREMGYAFLNRGNYPRALQSFLSGMNILEDPKSEERALVKKFPGDDELNYRTAPPHAQRLCHIAYAHQQLGILYANSDNYEKAWHHHRLARHNAEQSGSVPMQSIVNLTMNRIYLHLKKTDSALIAIQQAYEQSMQSGYTKYLGSVFLNFGRTYAALGNTLRANEYYRKSLVASGEQGYFRGLVAANLLLADHFTESGKKDSAFHYIKDALSAAKNLAAPDLLLRTYTALTRHYRTAGNSDSTVKYQALIIKINDSLFNAKQAQQFQNIDFDEQQRQQQIETNQKAIREKLRIYALLAGLSIILFIAIMLWRSNRHRQKSNAILKRQNREIQTAISNLKATQTQLIQFEKMASLGELTAGIAHEIQNPLNFVNNFSDVNTELIGEMKLEIDKGNFDEVKIIAADIEENEQKINHHGKRADAIVKGMLQHSSATSGKKEPTDINALADEYLRLSYHGLRGKDKDFNANLTTHFDESIEKIAVVPQDIGRVLLNLYNNAFYSVNEKKKHLNGTFEPTVEVSTKKRDGKIEIHVKDNGNGIPEKIVDKIFQPFFTTKPTGEGTGLGLSLSYDIIKAHGGELKVEVKEGDGAEFIVQLPAAINLKSSS